MDVKRLGLFVFLSRSTSPHSFDHLLLRSVSGHIGGGGGGGGGSEEAFMSKDRPQFGRPWVGGGQPARPGGVELGDDDASPPPVRPSVHFLTRA